MKKYIDSTTNLLAEMYANITADRLVDRGVNVQYKITIKLKRE